MRETIIKKLTWLLEDFELRKFYRGKSGVEMPEGAHLLPVSRVNFILNGLKRITLPLQSGAREVELAAGDWYCLQPDTWEFYQWDTAHEMLCIVPSVNFLRISFYRTDGTEPYSRESEYYHTARPYSDAFRHTLSALNYATGEAAIRHLTKALIALALEECLLPPEIQASGKAAYTFNRIRGWMEHHLQDDINRAKVAAKFNLSPSYLSQLFKEMCGMGFHEYLTSCRMDFAKTLLADTDMPVYLVADYCGFSNNVHFVRRFREINGMPPGKFRELVLQEKLKNGKLL